MNFIKPTKENLEEIIAQMATAKHSDANDKIALKYLNFFMSLPDDFEQKQIIRYMSGRIDERKSHKMDRRALRYKDDGYYEYSYYHNDRDNKNYYTLDEVYNDIPDCYVIQSDVRSHVVHYTYNEEFDCLIAYRYQTEKVGDEYVYKRQEEVCIFTRNKYRLRLCGYSWQKFTTTEFGLSDYNEEQSLTNHSLAREFVKMFKQPIVNIGANNFVTVDTFDALAAFLAYNAKLDVKDGPKQRKVEELTSIALPALPFEVPIDYCGESVSEPYQKTCVQKVKEGCCVVRWCLKGVYTDAECDGLRIYVEGKDIYPCKLNNNNQFVRTTISNIKPENFLSCDMEEIDKEVLSGTTLEYFGEIINDVPKEYRSLLLILFLKDPFIEQFFKMGLQKLIYEALNAQEYNVLSFVKECLGIIELGKNASKSLGINKHQFEYYKRMLDSVSTDNNVIYHNTTHFIGYLKDVVGAEKLSTLADAQFEKIAVAFYSSSKELRDSYYSSSISSYVAKLKEIRTKIEGTNNKNLIKRYFEILPDICKLPTNSIGLYRDYISMVATMEDFKNFKITVSDVNDVKEMHDAATSVYNLKKQEYKTKQFQSQLAKIEKLEYENKDDDFVVVIPKVPGDLAKEGLELHHCVKSYIEKVINGSTNIVFIRKKSDPEKPFFTVEVSNAKSVEQVHGFGNRNVNSEPGLEDFVKRWAKNKRLTVRDINKLR